MGVLQDLESHTFSVDNLHAKGVPTASIAILEEGNISTHVLTKSKVLIKGNVLTKGKENDETVYQACSISKAIAGIAVAKLVSDGKLSYDTKVIDYLEQSTIDCFVDEKTSHLLSHVTVGMLLSHTAGLSQHGFPGYINEPPTAEDVLSGRHPSNTPQVRFQSFPGQQFSYSGGGFTVLQIFLENFTKIPFPEFMKTTVLEPLGMTRSWYGTLPSDEHNFTNAYWTAYTEAGRHNFIELAAAGLWTTPTDLLKAISAVQDSVYTDNGLIDQATAKKMLSNVAEIEQLNVNMGMGWSVTDSIFAHSGGNEPGYRCYAFGFKDSDAKCRDGVAIMTNGLLGHDVCQSILNAILYLKGWRRVKAMPMLWPDDDEFAPLAASEGTKVADGWKEWTGKWEEGWEIVKNGGLTMKFKSFPAMRLLDAAVPDSKTDEGKDEYVFVADGLDFGVRLTWDGEDRVVKLLKDNSKVLKRRSSV